MNGHVPTLSEQLSDPNHPLRVREWNTYLERRQMLVDDLFSKLGLNAAMRGGRSSLGTDPVEEVDIDALADAIERMRMSEMADVGQDFQMRERDRQQTIGVGIAYGIPEAENMPIGELQLLIEQARVRRSEGEEFIGLGEVAGELRERRNMVPLLGMSGPVYLGATDTLIRAAETVPFLGDFISKTSAIQNMNRWIGAARESYVSDLDGRELLGAQIQEVAGGMAAYVPLALGAWRIAGFALGRMGIGGVTRAANVIRGNNIIQSPAQSWGLLARNPILFNGIRAGLGEVILEAGGDGPIQERVLNISLGATLGAVAEVGGAPAAAAFGGAIGGIAGGNVGEGYALEGFIAGVGAGLGLHRGFRAFARQSGLNQANQSSWFDVQNAETPAQLSTGNIHRAPRIELAPRRPSPQLAAVPDAPQLRGTSIASENAANLERHTWRGQRMLFYSGNEAPEELLRQWDAGHARGYFEEGQPTGLALDNVGRVAPGAKFVHAVEARFDNLFVVTPESAPILASIVGPSQDFAAIQGALRQRGFDGLAVQGIDDVVNQIGPDAAMQQLGLPPILLRDQVHAFGAPYQVRYSRPIVDGDLLDEIATDFGEDAIRQVAGVQSATFTREAGRLLKPFEVGAAADIPVARTLSEQRGIVYNRDPEAPGHPLVPPQIAHVVAQNDEMFGPRIVLLDEARMSQGTIPAATFDEAVGLAARLGFRQMEANDVNEAVRLAQIMSHGDTFTNNSMSNILGQVENPSMADLVSVSYIDNPGRVSVVNNIGDPFDLRRRLVDSNERYALSLDYDKNFRIVERSRGFHALVGPEDLLTPQIESQFKQFGMFSGMEASTADGMAVRVNSVWQPAKGSPRASISPIFSDVKATVPASYVLPGRTSVQQPLTGDIYKKFKTFALGKFNANASAGTIPLATELADPRVLSFVDRYVDEFGGTMNLNDYDRSRFADALEWNLAQDMRRLAGPEGKIFEATIRNQADEITKATENGRFVEPDLESLAISKGFIWEPPMNGQRGRLVDQESNLNVPFFIREAAEEFLRNFNRTAPDLNIGVHAEAAAFSGFNGGANSIPRGVEFPDDAAEVLSSAGTIRMQHRLAADEAEKAQLANDLADILNRADQRSGGGSSGGAGNPPPPTGGPPSNAPTPDDDDIARIMSAMRARKAIATPDEVEGLLAELKAQTPDQLHAYRNALNSPATYYTKYARMTAQSLDELMVKLGVERPTLWRDVSAVLDAKGISVNEASPWIDRLWRTVAPIDRAKRRLGPLNEILGAQTSYDSQLFERTGFETQRKASIARHKFSSEEVVQVEAIQAWWDEMHAAVVPFVERMPMLFDYMPQLRLFLDVHGDGGWAKWQQLLPNELKWVAPFFEEGNVHTYMQDAGRVAETYVRGLMFEKHMRVPYEQMKAQWLPTELNPSSTVSHPIRSWVGNLAYYVRHGHPPGHDAAVRGLTAMLSKFGVHLTEAETLNIFGSAFKLQYRNLLGNAPSKVIRELFQPMLAAPEVGFANIVGGYAKMAVPSIRKEWYERAVLNGAAETNRYAVANSEFFTGELRDALGRSSFPPEIIARRERWARRLDGLYNSIPNFAKQGIEGVPFIDPLWVYRAMATSPGRIITFNVGYENTAGAIQRWRSGKTSFQEMLEASDAANKPWSVRQEFTERIQAEDWEGAAVLMGREALSTQFYLGGAEASEAIRNSGVIGKAGMQFGNFSTQWAWKTAREAKYRPGLNKLKYLAGLGTLLAAPEVLGRMTGWEELKNFNWLRSLTWGGGPAVDVAISGYQALTGVQQQVAGEQLSPEQEFAQYRIGRQVGDFFSTLNPTAQRGAFRSATSYLDAFYSDNPAENAFRVTITGNSGTLGDAPQRFMDTFADQLQADLQTRRDSSIPLSPNRVDQGVTPQEWGSFLRQLDSMATSQGGSGAF